MHTELRPFAASTSKLAYAQAFTRDTATRRPVARRHHVVARLLRRG